MKGSLPDLWTSIIVVLIIFAASIAAYMVYNYYIGEGACERAVQNQVNKFVTEMSFRNFVPDEGDPDSDRKDRQITLLSICVEQVEPSGIKFRSDDETFVFKSPDKEDVTFSGITPVPRDKPYRVKLGPPYVITILSDK